MQVEQALKSGILKEFLNEDYLELDNLENVKKALNNNFPKSLKLEDFFKKEKYNLLKDEIRNLRYKRKYFPDKLSFGQGELGRDFKRLFESQEFKSLFEFILSKRIDNFNANALMLKHKDYTLLSDEGSEISGFWMNFFFNDFWREDYGGYFSFVSENEEVLRILPTENSVTIVYIDKTIDGFIKYINVNSGNRKIYFIKTIIL